MSFGHRVDELIEAQGNALTATAPHWLRVRLCDVAAVINGFPFDSDGFNNEQGDPVIRIRDIVPGRASSYFNGPTDNAPRVETGDLVIGMDGDFNSRLWAGPPALLNQRVCKVAPDESFYSKRLLAYALPGYLKLINDYTSAVTVKHLSSRTVDALPLPLAPRAEQDRIVSKIDELFSRIDEGEQALGRVAKLVERYRQSVLKAAVTGELTRDWREARKLAGEPVESGADLLARILKARRAAWEQAELAKLKAKGKTPIDDRWKQKYKEPAPPDTTDPSALPEGWVWATVDQLSSDVTYGTSAKCNDDISGVPVLRMGNISAGKLDIEKLKYLSADHAEFPALLLESGDLLFNRTNSAELVGKSAIFDLEGKHWSFASYLIRVRVLTINAEWLASYINSVFGRDWIREVKNQQVGQANVNGSKLKALAIPLPPLQELTMVLDLMSREISSIEALDALCQAESERVQALRQSILKAAFSGQLVPQDPDDEPASKLLERIAAERANSVTPQRKRIKKTA